MSRVQRCFESLASAGFLRHHLSGNQLELLSHGRAYAEQLQKQWLSLRPLAAHLSGISEIGSTSPLEQRFSFARTTEFSSLIQRLQKDHPRKAKCPTVIKHKSNSSSFCLRGNPLFSVKSPATILTTDFLVEPDRALEHFYNIQRESKIWWMRLSSNPSRIRIVPCDLPEEFDPKSYQAIDLRSQAGEVTVEELSMVRLGGDDGPFRLPDGRTGESVQPTVIRSVIELETATCALLLDGCDHERDAQSLLLNCALAPYQCGIACLLEESGLSGDLDDLCLHLKHVLNHAGLRLCQGKGFFAAKDNGHLADHFAESDMLGVPYTLVVNDQTLKNGLMKLRSRDTRLSETIHISDVPDYLLNIFKK
ncbi:DNA polymerase subunit gamma-2, mitochondrial [Drosophila serrata]|uniref:DNA polymerase subunit gamma-2, mitochondrial n=1 Tax=Drosophila serrata TaxID=7274 RepID=UPI000A1D2F88|nr:DNA polymerase subunit gamma-2, mitochondrial [Drosophila serrata]